MRLLATAPSPSPFKGFDHIHFWVGNARQAASYYVTHFGFQPLAYRGLETGCRTAATHVVQQGRIRFAFSSTLTPGDRAFGDHLALHGDGVKDVALEVTDCEAVYLRAVANGAAGVRAPAEEADGDGAVVLATVEPYPGTWHTFVERGRYKGPFLPGFEPAQPPTRPPSPAGLQFIDHVVSNQHDGGMEPVVQWYTDKLGFKRFWSVDDSQIHTEFSSLRSVVVADPDEVVKMPINEPAEGRRKSQIQEFVEFYGGPGIQHIALNTEDILTAVQTLRRNGVSFIEIPDTYYAQLRERLGRSSLHVAEALDAIQATGVLVDFDERGYLLQTFTRPQQDRPTLFLEVIQRRGLDGFGVGNFQALFQAIEADQDRRGNL